MNMAGRLIALRRGGKEAPLAFNFRWLSAPDMTICFFQLSDFRDCPAIAAIRLNWFAWETIPPGRFAAWRSPIL
jgi:hypothetical protein